MSQSKSHNVTIPVGGVSFLVKIQFSQNSTWQGTVQWLDEKKSMPFRSLLELIQLVNDAINHGAQTTPDSLLWVEKQDVS